MKDCVRVKIKAGQFQNRGLQKARYTDFVQNIKTAMKLFGQLPDVDFWFCINDESHLPKSLFKNEGLAALPRPPLSFSMHSDYHDISIPFKLQDPSSEHQLLEMLETWRNAFSWKEKTAKAVWRGSPTGHVDGQECSAENWKELPRSQLINLSLQNPDVLDASFSKMNRQCPKAVAGAMKHDGYGFKAGFQLKDYFSYTTVSTGPYWNMPRVCVLYSSIFRPLLACSSLHIITVDRC